MIMITQDNENTGDFVPVIHCYEEKGLKFSTETVPIYTYTDTEIYVYIYRNGNAS